MDILLNKIGTDFIKDFPFGSNWVSWLLA